MKLLKRVIPFHPFLLAVFPAITLFVSNSDILEVSMIWAIVGIMLAIALIFLFLGRLLFRDFKRGAIWSSLIALLITNYGNYQDHLLHIKIPFFFKPIRMDHNFYLWSSLVLILLLSYILWKTKAPLIRPTKLLNLIALALFVSSFFASGSTIAGNNSDNNIDHKSEADVLQLQSTTGEYPDIYYFVMDAYGRADVLKDLYDFDNADFLKYLRDKGFFIADSSTSNYGQTVLSIPSALNMEYADELVEEVGDGHGDRKPLHNWLLNNRVLASLKAIGYKNIATDASIFGLVTYSEGVDLFYRTPGTDLNLFENHYLNTTVIRAFNKRKAVTVLDQYGMHRKKILNAFSRIKKVANKKGHFFVYGHILSPHQPFVFGKNGEPVKPDYEYTIWKPRETGYKLDDYKSGYINQLQFVNKKLKETIDYILANSKNPPIIIIQGDHGPASGLMNINGYERNNFKERMSIMNAYYFPNQDYSNLYDTISPVNSFRVIFNQYFGTDMELVPDKAIFSNWTYPYQFYNVTDSIR